jgi:hypothetical protein
MSIDDINTFSLALHDWLIDQLGYPLDENEDYDSLSAFVMSHLEPFETKERNYN